MGEIRRKNLNVDQTKLDRAREILGVKTETEAVDQALSMLLSREEGGYFVSVPGLPGCWSQGDTEIEALANIREAILEYLAARDDLLRIRMSGK